MEHEQWLQIARILHYAVRLPVRLYHRDEKLLALPESCDPVWDLFSYGGEPSSWPVARSSSLAQYILGRTGERYICQFSQDAYALCIGPFCTDPLHDKDLNRQLRIYFASVKDREAVRAGIRSLPCLSEDCFFYTGQLVQTLCNAPASPHAISVQSLPPDNIQSSDALYRHPPFFLEREITQCIAEQDEKSALNILSEINRLHRANLSDQPLRSLKNSLICSCSLFARAAIAGGAMPDAAFSHSDASIRTIEEMNNMERLAEYEYTMVREFIHLVRRRREGGISAVIRTAIIYANEHLLEPIAVQSIAKSIYVNPSYLSSLFKQEIGESLSHYIRRKRIRHAERLLREGYDTMVDIAAVCQFCSQSHFIQVFKTMKGLTPEQFRRMEGTLYRQNRLGNPIMNRRRTQMKLTRTGLHLNEIALRESLFHVSNGYLGVRACLEEGVPQDVHSIRGAYLNAFYDTYPIQYAEKLYGFPKETETIVNVPDMQGITLVLDGERFDPCIGTLLRFEQTLDMSAGQYIRQIVWRSLKGRETEIVFRRMASFTAKELLTIHVTITPQNWSGGLKIISGQNSDVCNDGDPNDPRKASEIKRMLKTVESGHKEQYMYMQCETLRSRQTVACAAAHTCNTSLAAKFHSTPALNTATFEGQAAKDIPLSFVKWCVYTDSRRHSSPLSTAVKLVKTYAEMPIETWYQRQQAVLDKFWDAARVTLQGQPSLQTGIDYAAYTLFQSAGQDGISSIASKGLSGEGYEGHYFWDTEIYMFPFFLLTHPKIARLLLEYRYATLEAAKRHARILGHKTGALYPWRTITGNECSSYFPSGSAQYHINSDIANAIYTYYFVTGDLAFIRDKGADILIETARLWLDVGHWHEGQYHIDGVTGPDEYTCLVNNNYYTNLSVKYHLQNTLYLCDCLREAYPELSLEERYGLNDAELKEFENIRKSLYLPFDETLGIYAQDDSFLHKQKMNLSSMSKDNFPLLLHFHPLVFYRQQVCKQADAVLAHFLYEDGISDAVIRRTYDYYEAITTHDSSLSPCVFSMMAARIGEPEKALGYYMHSIFLDLEDKQGNTDDGIHAANMGGSYMGIVFGFAGLRIHQDNLSLRPCIPKSIKSYSFPIQYRGNRIRLEVTQEIITLQPDGLTPLDIMVYDTVIPVTDQCVAIPLNNQLSP